MAKIFNLTDRQARADAEALVEEALALEIAADMSEPEVLAAQEKIERANTALAEMMNAVRGQIDEENAKLDADSNYAVDPKWWRRVNGAARHKGWQRQQLQKKIGEVNRLLRAFRFRRGPLMEKEAYSERVRGRDRLFVRIAQLHLPPAQYRRLCNLVEEAERAQQEESP